MAQRLRHHLGWMDDAHEAATVAQEQQRRSQERVQPPFGDRLPVGAVVFLRQMLIGHKLTHRFLGPFRVVGDRNANYIIATEDGRLLAQSFPRGHLFEVAQPEVIPSLCQAACYGANEWRELLDSLVDTEPGPIPGMEQMEQGGTAIRVQQEESGPEVKPWYAVQEIWRGQNGQVGATECTG